MGSRTQRDVRDARTGVRTVAWPASPPPDGAVIDRAVRRSAASPGPAPDPRQCPASPATGAVIIPAHDESAVIARLLRSLAPLAALDGIEVIVACNGCRDDTAAIARSFDNVRVVELARASKTDALNLADDVATAWPRLYVDADVELDPQTVLRVFVQLRRPGVRAARPPHVYDVTGATPAVRAYYRARSAIPGQPRRLWGAGAYGTNEAGHRRFGRFAPVTADDSWFDGQFDHDEKQVVDAAPTVVHTPRDVATLLALLTRQRRGYVDLEIASEAPSRTHALLRSVRGPRSAVDAGWYIVLTLAARLRSAGAGVRAEPRWERDASSRVSEAAR